LVDALGLGRHWGVNPQRKDQTSRPGSNPGCGHTNERRVKNEQNSYKIKTEKSGRSYSLHCLHGA